MSAQILLLAALQSPAKEKSFMVAGTHTTNIWGRIQSEAFEFRVLRPELLQGATPGELLLIEARLQPLDDLKGQLLLIPSSVTRLGHHQTTLTERGYTYTTGIQRVTVSGNLTGTPHVEDFGKGLIATSFALELNPNAKAALLDVMVYGESAATLGTRQPGDRYTGTGHLKAEKSIDPRGRETVRFTLLPDRADVEDAASFERRTSRSKDRAARTNGRPDNRKPPQAGQAPQKPRNDKDAQNPARPKQPRPDPTANSQATDTLDADVAALVAPGPKERRSRTVTPVQPFTATEPTAATQNAPAAQDAPADQNTETLDIRAVAGSMTANLDTLLTPTPDPAKTDTAEPTPTTEPVAATD